MGHIYNSCNDLTRGLQNIFAVARTEEKLIMTTAQQVNMHDDLPAVHNDEQYNYNTVQVDLIFGKSSSFLSMKLVLLLAAAEHILCCMLHEFIFPSLSIFNALISLKA